MAIFNNSINFYIIALLSYSGLIFGLIISKHCEEELENAQFFFRYIKVFILSIMISLWIFFIMNNLLISIFILFSVFVFLLVLMNLNFLNKKNIKIKANYSKSKKSTEQKENKKYLIEENYRLQTYLDNFLYIYSGFVLFNTFKNEVSLIVALLIFFYSLIVSSSLYYYLKEINLFEKIIFILKNNILFFLTILILEIIF
ncbi:MAG: hypothetical protein QXE31_03155 [Candidatus Woesearchaeota archaeon]